MPWSNEVYERNPVITNETVIKANLELKGKTALDILDIVVQELSNNSIMIILDNHMSDSDWCCSETDENGLWFVFYISYLF